MQKKIAFLVSFIAHPLLMPTYLFAFLLSLQVYIATYLGDFRWHLLFMVFIATFVLPSLMVFFMYRLGTIQTITMKRKDERTFPLLVTGVIYIIAYQQFRKMGLPDQYFMILLGAATVIILSLIINFFWKISLHMMGIGGATGIMAGLSLTLPVRMLYPVMAGFAIAGIVGAARIYLNEHKPSHIYTGFVVGFVAMIILFGMLL